MGVSVENMRVVSDGIQRDIVVLRSVTLLADTTQRLAVGVFPTAVRDAACELLGHARHGQV